MKNLNLKVNVALGGEDVPEVQKLLGLVNVLVQKWKMPVPSVKLTKAGVTREQLRKLVNAGYLEVHKLRDPKGSLVNGYTLPGGVPNAESCENSNAGQSVGMEVSQ